MNALSSCSLSVPVDDKTRNGQRGCEPRVNSREREGGGRKRTRQARVLLREMEINFSECDCNPPRMRSPCDDELQHLEQQNFTCLTFDILSLFFFFRTRLEARHLDLTESKIFIYVIWIGSELRKIDL